MLEKSILKKMVINTLLNIDCRRKIIKLIDSTGKVAEEIRVIFFHIVLSLCKKDSKYHCLLKLVPAHGQINKVSEKIIIENRAGAYKETYRFSQLMSNAIRHKYMLQIHVGGLNQLTKKLIDILKSLIIIEHIQLT